MNIAQIENNLQGLLKAYSRESFIYDLLLAYGFPKSTIERLKNGTHNLSKRSDQIILKKKLLFQEVAEADLHSTIDDLRRDEKASRHEPRFILVTDYETLLAVDTKTQDTLDIKFGELAKHFDFFLPWAGMEKASYQTENPADVKAAERMARLFDEIRKDNPNNSLEFTHSLNVFLTRLLFCFFAEDTNIFEKGQFTGAISSHTQPDGSDLSSYLGKFFDVLNTDKSKRKNPPAYLDAFPYVNGGLFRDKHPSPIFTRKSRQLIIESGELDWSAINPDIFGSMMQAVVTPEHRGGLGMHYTSVPNIMKVIEPLFLNELREEFEKAKGNSKKFEQLLKRLRNIKIFDPACGSGNFLIIAYKELRKLEMEIFKEEKLLALSRISLSQFYGIEIDDFAHEVAKLSLWLAEHQMNVVFFKEFGRTNPPLPLKEAGHVICENATRLNWEDVCPKVAGDEIYILGNPPYQGARKQNDKQKSDLAFVFSNSQSYRNLDYISCWFLLSAKYISGFNAKFAFVSTNSICQGEQVEMLWPCIFSNNVEILFAHQSFKWTNNAKHKAAVICIIVGVANLSKLGKSIYKDGLRKSVNSINPYLSESSGLMISKRTTPISNLPPMPKGNMPYDGGSLILSNQEKNHIIAYNPKIQKFIKRLMGAEEFINGIERWCLWIRDEDFKTAMLIPEIANRVEAVRQMRLKSSDVGAHRLALRPHQFREVYETKTNSIIVPSVSSERREYIPIGFINSGTIVTNLAFVIYEASPWLFGVVSSRMHMTWVRNVAGRLKSDYRYSSAICYNTFPVPDLSKKQKELIEINVFRIIEEREKFSQKTMAELYDPDKMPNGLKDAHRGLDQAVEGCYRSASFKSDEERIDFLFKLYEKMVCEEKSRSGELLFGVSETKKVGRTQRA